MQYSLKSLLKTIAIIAIVLCLLINISLDFCWQPVNTYFRFSIGWRWYNWIEMDYVIPPKLPRFGPKGEDYGEPKEPKGEFYFKFGGGPAPAV